MGFSMRMPLNSEIVKKDTVRNEYIDGKKCGFSFNVQLGYYRGHYLSTIDLLEVYLDGKKIPQEAVTFCINHKELPVYKLKYSMSEYWCQVDQAKINVIYLGGLTNGEHEIELKLMLRIPYMELGPDHQFMPLDSGDKVTVNVEE